MQSKDQMISEKEAIEMLNGMDAETISKLQAMSGTFRKPWGSKHNAARSERARARIAKRKAKR